MITIYTDGGCSGNPGPGGWAFVALAQNGAMIACQSGGERQTTNNRMELRAVISALEFAQDMSAESVVICTDSQYVKNGITDWIRKWKINGWKNSKKEAVKNRELWEELDDKVSHDRMSFRWVKGHAGIEFNEKCDQMVRAEMEKFL